MGYKNKGTEQGLLVTVNPLGKHETRKKKAMSLWSSFRSLSWKGRFWDWNQGLRTDKVIIKKNPSEPWSFLIYIVGLIGLAEFIKRLLQGILWKVHLFENRCESFMKSSCVYDRYNLQLTPQQAGRLQQQAGKEHWPSTINLKRQK